MLQILLIEKDGNIIEKNVKSLEKMYSFCGYRTNKDFEKLCQWDTYELYGKRIGKKDKENNYTFPTNDTYYGTLCIIKKNDSITLDEWKLFYLSKMKDMPNLCQISGLITKKCIDSEDVSGDTCDEADSIELDSNIDIEQSSENDNSYLEKHLDEELKYEEYEEE